MRIALIHAVRVAMQAAPQGFYTPAPHPAAMDCRVLTTPTAALARRRLVR